MAGRSKKKLQDALDAMLEDGTEDFVEMARSAMHAEKPAWASCPNCRKRVEVQNAPDWSARARFVELITTLLYGRNPIADKEVNQSELLTKPAEEMTPQERLQIIEAARRRLTEKGNDDGETHEQAAEAVAEG